MGACSGSSGRGHMTLHRCTGGLYNIKNIFLLNLIEFFRKNYYYFSKKRKGVELSKIASLLNKLHTCSKAGFQRANRHHYPRRLNHEIRECMVRGASVAAPI
jgi:hypothetical protein